MRILMIWVLMAVLAIGIIVHRIDEMPDVRSDAYIRDRVVKLQGDVGGCSGIQVQAPSGKVYILSARHCQKISSDGDITATDEQGHTKKVTIIAVDKDSDLLLLTPMSIKFITIADKLSLHEHVHTLTHGNMNPTYRTDGEALIDRLVEVALAEIISDEDVKACQASGGKVYPSFFSLVCVGELNVRITTAWVAPGSSGGAALNENGQLIGIVSLSSGLFSGIVRLEDITRFLKDK
jgi:S1-C subfamily serine protease